MVNSQANTHSRIGQEVDTLCGKCGMERTHRIVAQDPDGTIRKVICAMCNSYRNYRPPKPQDSKVTKTRAPRSTANAAPEDFGRPDRNYNMKENFQVGEVIAHSTFGVGKVINIKDGSKIEVKFLDGVKVLLQNR